MKLKTLIICSALVLGSSATAFADQFPTATFYNANSSGNLNVTFQNCVNDSEGNLQCQPLQTVANIKPGNSFTINNNHLINTGSDWVTEVISASIGKAHSTYGANSYEECSAWTHSTDSNRNHLLNFTTGGTSNTVFCDGLGR